MSDVKVSEMSRMQLLQAIRDWQADDEQGYDTAIELLCEAADRLERETYLDGVGHRRCELCKQEILA